MTLVSDEAERTGWISPDLITFGEVRIGTSVVIEPMCILGKPSYESERSFHRRIMAGEKLSYREMPTLGALIENQVYIGSGSLILEGSVLCQNSELEDRVRIGANTIIGAGTRIMYEALIYNRVKIGDRCNISGFICNDTTIENSVSFFGKTVHRYENYIAPKSERNSAILKAPCVRSGSIVAMDAILIGGVTIGEGAYVAAGAVISVDVPDRHIAFSNDRIIPMG